MTLRALLLGVVALPLALLPARSRAQTIRGVAVTSGEVPVSGVVVLLLDSASITAARALTDDRGEFQLAAPRGGTYRMRTFRIGFRPVTSEPLVLSAGMDVTRRLALTEVRVRLDTIRIVGRNACRAVRDSALAVHAIWQQVRAALDAVDLTASTGAIAATVVGYERMMDRNARVVREQTAEIVAGLVTQPWHSLTPDSLHRVGYVSVADNDVATYQAPGLDVLLSNAFVEDHCFRVASGSDPTLLGITFEPTPERRRVAEIQGTIWLDRRSGELRSMTYRYVNVPRTHQDMAGGDMQFVRMRDAHWAVSRWNIRMPVLMRGMSSGNEARVSEVKVRGGELALAVRGADTLWSRPPLVLSGTVADSTSWLPVRDARVALVGTRLRATTDAAGVFAISEVLPGEYTLEVRTASLDSVTAVSRSQVEFTDASTRVHVRVPSGHQISRALCGDAPREAPGIVVGTLELRGDSAPPRNARVVAQWQQPFLRSEGGLTVSGSRSRWTETRSDARGGFRLCGVPVNTTLTVLAESDSLSGSAEARIPLDGRVARVELTLGVSAARGAVFAGIVVTDSGQVIADAEVVFPELGKSGLTNERGAFRVAEIPAGTQHVTVRRMGYGPLETEIDFGAGQTQQRRIVLTKAQALPQVAVVEEKRSRAPAIEGFLKRQRDKTGGGFFMSREQLEPHDGERLTNILRQVRGVTIIRQRGGKNLLRFGRVTSNRANCTPATFLDGVETRDLEVDDISTADVEAIELYTGSSGAPSELASRTNYGCGVIAIWTRRPILFKPKP